MYFSRRTRKWDKKLLEMEAKNVAPRNRRNGIRFKPFCRFILNIVLEEIRSDTVWIVKYRWSHRDHYLEARLDNLPEDTRTSRVWELKDRLQLRGALLDVNTCSHPEFVLFVDDLEYCGHSSYRKKGYMPLTDWDE